MLILLGGLAHLLEHAAELLHGLGGVLGLAVSGLKLGLHVGQTGLHRRAAISEPTLRMASTTAMAPNTFSALGRAMACTSVLAVIRISVHETRPASAPR